MGIGIYTDTVPSALLSEGGLHTNDFLVSLNGKTGGVIQRRLYVRNNDSLYYYTNTAIVTNAPLSGAIFIDGSNGYSWKLSAGATQPTDLDWSLTSGGNSILIPDLGSLGNPDTTTYHSFWVRIEVPQNVDVRTFTDIEFTLTSTENLV